MPPSTEHVQWDFRLENEFYRPRQTGCTFVIDVLDNNANLAIYHIRPFFSHSTTLSEQPPRELLLQALKEQNVSLAEDGLYPVNKQIRTWIENNILKKNLP